MKIKLFLSLSLLLFSGCFFSISAEESLAKDHRDWFSYNITDNSESSDSFLSPDEMMTRARDLTHDEIITACGPGEYPPTPDYIFNTIIVNASGFEAKVTVSSKLKGTGPKTIPTGGVLVLPFAGKRSLGTGTYVNSIRAIVNGQQVNFNPRQPVPGGLFILKRPDIGQGFCFAGPVYEEYKAPPEVSSNPFPAGFYTATFVNATGTGLKLDIYNGGGPCASIKSKERDFPNGAYAQIDTLDKCKKGCKITRVSNRTNASPGLVIYEGPGVCNGVFVFSDKSTGHDRYVLYPAP